MSTPRQDGADGRRRFPQRLLGAGRRAGREDEDAPCSVVIDLESWENFSSWGAALHHRGWRVHRVRPPATGARGRARGRLVEVMLGEPPVHVDAADGAPVVSDELAALVARADDVQGTETAMSALRDAGLLPPGTLKGRVPDEARQLCLYDKWLMTERAAALGLGVPQSWQAPPPDVRPLVVKGRIGAGGQAVVIAHDDAELDAAIASLTAAQGMAPFFQELMPGAVINAAGVADKGRLLVHALYEAQPPADDPLGPPEILRIGDYPQIADELAQLVRALEFSGIFCVDYILAPDGRVGLLDFNPRVFGGWLALQRAGVDLLGAHTAALGRRSPPAPTALPVGTEMHDRLLPAASVTSGRQLVSEVRRSLAAVRAIRPLTGRPYASLQLVRGARQTLALVSELRGRGPS